MLKRTLIRFCEGNCVFRRFEHPQRGTVDTLTYPCGRLVYVAKGFKPVRFKSLTGVSRRARKRLGAMWSGGNRAAGGEG